MYRGAKPGQAVFYARNAYEERAEVQLVYYYKDHKQLAQPNCAVISDNGINIHVPIKNIYRKKED